MAPQRRIRTYTPAQRIALVTEIDRRYRAGSGSIQAIATSLGVSDKTYYGWVKAGIMPLPAAVTARVYTSAEREALLARVDSMRADGQTLEAACRAAGIAKTSYAKWKDDLAPPPAMRPVEITALVPVAPAALTTPAPLALAAAPPPAPAAQLLTLVAPGGYRIEGLAVETAAALLRALA